MSTGRLPILTKLIILSFCLQFCLTGCNKPRLPIIPEKSPCIVCLHFNTAISKWETTEQLLKSKTKAAADCGTMRYEIKVYKSQQPVAEYHFTRDGIGYEDVEFEIDLPGGEYCINVWADIQEHSYSDPFYGTSDFTYINLIGDHRGNTDLRDAFKGTATVNVINDGIERPMSKANIEMTRPLAKWECIATDFDMFLEKERTKAANFDLDKYKVVFSYVGFMPSAYSILTDKPVDAKTGVTFQSKLRYNEVGNVSLGFDYVFVNGVESKVTIQAAVYDDNNQMISMTDPIDVPLVRNRHTIVQGDFLTAKALGGVNINNQYDGEFTINIQ